MTVETAHFLPAGESLEGCKRFYKEYVAALDAWLAFSKEIGATTKIAFSDYTGNVTGFTFPADAKPDPTVWREDKKGRCWVPRRNTPAGKAMAERVEALPKQPTQWRAHEYVGVPGDAHFGVCHFSSGRTHSRCSIGWRGDQYIIGVWFAVGLDSAGKAKEHLEFAVPPGAKEIPASEYATLMAGVHT